MTKKKKRVALKPCATCGNDILLHRDRFQKCPFCKHWNKWDGKQIEDVTGK